MKKITIMGLLLLDCAYLMAQLSILSGSDISKLEIKADIVYDRQNGMDLTLDMFKPADSNGAAVIFMNNGGFVSGKIRFLDKDSSMKIRYLGKNELMIFPERFSYPPLAQYSIDDLISKGFTVFDVRPRSDPDFTLDKITGDCRSAINFIIDHAAGFGINKEQIGVFGASSGGYLASFLGTDNLGIRAVGLFYPTGYDFSRLKKDFPEVAGEFKCLEMDSSLLAKLSLKNRISESSADFLIIYGNEDFPFITADCKDLAAGLKSAGRKCEVISLEGTGHEFRLGKEYNTKYGDFARVTMADWFEKKLIIEKHD